MTHQTGAPERLGAPASAKTAAGTSRSELNYYPVRIYIYAHRDLPLMDSADDILARARNAQKP